MRITGIESLLVDVPLREPVKGVQEQRIELGRDYGQQADGTAAVRPRIARLLRGFRDGPPRVAVERARYMTESFRTTEALPPVLRWAHALDTIMTKIAISIGEDDLIVGRCGPPGRHGILYPELRGAWLERGLATLASRKEGAVTFTEEDARVIRDEILPYWKGRTVFEAHYAMVPEATRRILYRDEDPYTPRYLGSWAKGARLEEARDYSGSGCTEVRMLNRDTYMTGNSIVNMGAAVEMALHDGRVRLSGDERFGVATGDPRGFHTFDDVLAAFKLQVEHLVRHVFVQNRMADTIRPRMLAAPLESSLHDLCMEHGVDIHQGRIEGGIVLGAWDPIGFGTAVDSLVAVKKLVFDDGKVTMAELVDALATNFEGNEVLRQMCVNAPKFGNNDPYADDIAVELEDFFRSLSDRYTNLYGGRMDVRYVPVTAYMPLGRVVGATPNGRKATEPLSDGISPSQGCDSRGPTAVLMSIARTNESRYPHAAAKLLNMKLCPQAVHGEEGTRRLASLIRSWCDLKLWHIQFNIINNETLRAAQRDPEKYRNLLVRVAGSSARTSWT